MISLEYFLGSFLTLGLAILLLKYYKPKPLNSSRTGYSQSYILKMTGKKMTKKDKLTQSSKHIQQSNIKVLVMEDRAFWIKNNAVYTAQVDGDEIIKSSASQVDMIGLNKVELDKMIFIIDQLTERQNDDRRDPGV